MGMINDGTTLRSPPHVMYQGEVRELRKAEGDVVIAPPHAAPAARYKIRDERQYRALEEAQRRGLPVQVVINRAGLIEGLRVPTLSPRSK